MGCHGVSIIFFLSSQLFLLPAPSCPCPPSASTVHAPCPFASLPSRPPHPLSSRPHPSPRRPPFSSADIHTIHLPTSSFPSSIPPSSSLLASRTSPSPHAPSSPSQCAEADSRRHTVEHHRRLSSCRHPRTPSCPPSESSFFVSCHSLPPTPFVLSKHPPFCSAPASASHGYAAPCILQAHPLPVHFIHSAYDVDTTLCARLPSATHYHPLLPCLVFHILGLRASFLRILALLSLRLVYVFLTCYFSS